jgi:hypothetical protein
MKEATLEVGDVMQLGPACQNQMFAFCMFMVTEPKPWGAQGFVQALGANGKPGGQAYYRATWEEMEPTGGKAEWVPA